jgi:excisionase family DNA binding protein
MTTAFQHRWHSTKHVADVLSISERHARRMIAAGEIKAIRLGRVLRVSDEALAELVNTHAVDPCNPPTSDGQPEIFEEISTFEGQAIDANSLPCTLRFHECQP